MSRRKPDVHDRVPLAYNVFSIRRTVIYVMTSNPLTLRSLCRELLIALCGDWPIKGSRCTVNQMADLALTHLRTQHIERIVIDIAHTTTKREKQHLLFLAEWLNVFGFVDISIDFSLNSPARRFKPPKRPPANPGWRALDAARPEGSIHSVPAALECASCQEGARK